MDAPAWVALGLTLKVAAWATALNLLLGTAVGWLLARRRFVGRDLIDSVLTLPLVLPPTVMGYYLLVLIGKRGPIAATVVAFPLILRSARTAFESVDPQLEQAARVLGLGEWALFVRVSLPMAWPGILAGTLLVFARSLGEFGATLMVAGSIPGRTQTLSIAVYEAVQAGQDDTANVLVAVTSITCIAVLLAAGRLAPVGRGR
jgi:molybdate transport system permease protein